MNNYLGQNIRHLRVSKEVTQEQLAEIIGKKRTMIGAYENGTAEPNIEVLRKISDFFGESVDSLIGQNLVEKNGDKKNNLEKSKNDVGFDVGFSQNHNTKTRQKEGKDKQNHNKLGVDFEKEKAFKIKMSEERGKEGMKLNALKLLIKQKQLSDIQEIITEFFYYSKAITYFFDKRVNPKHEWNELFITDYKQYIDDFIKVLSDLQVHREEIQVIIESMKAFVEKANIDTDEETNDYVKDIIDFL